MGRKVSKTGRWTSGPPWGPRDAPTHLPSAIRQDSVLLQKGTLQSWCIHPAASASTAGNEQTMSCHGIHRVREAMIPSSHLLFDRRWTIGAILGRNRYLACDYIPGHRTGRRR